MSVAALLCEIWRKKEDWTLKPQIFRLSAASGRKERLKRNIISRRRVLKCIRARRQIGFILTLNSTLNNLIFHWINRILFYTELTEPLARSRQPSCTWRTEAQKIGRVWSVDMKQNLGRKKRTRRQWGSETRTRIKTKKCLRHVLRYDLLLK